jgi:hypothetical protein
MLKPTFFCAVPRVLDRIYSGELFLMLSMRNFISMCSLCLLKILMNTFASFMREYLDLLEELIFLAALFYARNAGKDFIQSLSEEGLVQFCF